MGLIAFMHDYEFVRRLGFFVLQTSEHFVPTPFSSYTSSTSFLPPRLEFTLALLTTEKIFLSLCFSSREFSALFSHHPLTHSPVLSCYVAPDREHRHHLSRSTPSLYSSLLPRVPPMYLRFSPPFLFVPLPYLSLSLYIYLYMYVCYSPCLSSFNIYRRFSRFVPPLHLYVSSPIRFVTACTCYSPRPSSSNMLVFELFSRFIPRSISPCVLS